jgi:thiol-disulfide isomerase/thioredoxin
MSDKISIILAKASWCPHCIHFTPIFDLASKKINENNELKDKKFFFYSFDVEDQEQKNKFYKDFPGLSEFIEGYPTVFMQTKNGNKTRTDFIDHVNIKPSENDNVNKEEVMNKLQKEAADTFVNSIINKYKTVYSDKKDVFVNAQKGGFNLKRISSNDFTSLEESSYRQKYLKYKNKYIELQSNQ